MAGEAPTGTATVVLGDVAGSTRLWQEHPGVMTGVSRRIVELLEELTAAHGGHRPREQGEGDNFVATFAAAVDAAAFAVSLDAALAAEPWPADVRIGMRMGVHTGDVVWDEDIGYLGPTFNRCARLRDLGRARMILLSETTRDVVADQLPDGASVVDLGSHQLRDLSRTEHVHQLRHPGTPETFAPLKSVTALPNNLPVPITSLFGRDDDIADVVGHFGGHRLVTLTGSGGAGKTRLAQHVASELLRFAPDGAWWVDLLPVTDERVPVAIAEAVGIDDVVASSHAGEIVAAGIDDQRLLLVLDNCEHVIDAAADMVELLLRRCPNVVVLATSRETLDVPGEHSVRVRPLAVPDGTDSSLATLAAHPATNLFLERATTIDRDGLDELQRRAVIEVCRRLDGIPLAIELAAARTRVLSVTEIEAGLDDRFGLLTGSRRGRRSGARQRTLESSIAWSFDLLDDEEEAMLCRLSVYPSSFDLDGARAVGAPNDPAGALDLLASLVDKSLVAARPVDGDRPYRLLESIAHYAGERLQQRGDDDAARLDHLRHTLRRIAELGHGLPNPGDVIGPVVRIPPALRDDLLAAEATALAAQRYADAVDLYSPLYMTLVLSGDYRAAIPMLREVLADDQPLDALHEGRALALLLGCLASANQQPEALALRDRALAVGRELAATGTPQLLQPILTTLANATTFAGHSGASDLAREAMEVAHDLTTRMGEPGWIAYAAPWCAVALAQDGFEAAGLAVAQQGLADADAVGFDHLAALSACYVAVIALRLRPMDALPELLEDARRRIPDDAPRLHALLAGTAGVWSGVIAGDAATTSAWLEHGLAHAGPPGSGTHLLMQSARAVERFGAGDADGMVAFGDQVAARIARTGNRWWQTHARMIVAMGKVARGDADADDAVRAARDLLPGGGEWPLLTWLVDGAEGRLHLAHDRPEDALRVARRIASDGRGDASEARLHWALPLAVAAFAAIDQPGRAARALGALERCTDESGRVDLHPEATAAAARAARSALDLDKFEAERTAGAAMLVEDAVAWLVGQDSDWPVTDRPVAGWGSLTPAEQEVARTIAGGVTNREAGEALFVSENTIKTHLKSIYSKLDISSRAELATEVAVNDAHTA